MSKQINPCGCGGKIPVEVFKRYKLKAYCVACRVCGCKGGFAASTDVAIELWNAAHPEISNAAQAVKWLEEGKRITSYSYGNDRYLELQSLFSKNEFCVSCSKATKIILEHDIPLAALFTVHNWELYEEPKYKEVTGIKALERYTNDESLKIAVFIGEYEYSLSHNEDDGVGLYNAQLDDSHPLTLELLQEGTWRIYE